MEWTPHSVLMLCTCTELPNKFSLIKQRCLFPDVGGPERYEEDVLDEHDCVEESDPEPGALAAVLVQVEEVDHVDPRDQQPSLHGRCLLLVLHHLQVTN